MATSKGHTQRVPPRGYLRRPGCDVPGYPLTSTRMRCSGISLRRPGCGAPGMASYVLWLRALFLSQGLSSASRDSSKRIGEKTCGENSPSLSKLYIFRFLYAAQQPWTENRTRSGKETQICSCCMRYAHGVCLCRYQPIICTSGCFLLYSGNTSYLYV